MSDIFLSYAREDRERVRPLVEALQAAGWTVWWDYRIPAGKTFDEVIEKALGEARCVLVVWSARSVAKQWVRTEAEEGRRRNILVPVLIDDVKPPLAFRVVQAADLSGWDGDTGAEVFQRLLADLAEVLGVPNAVAVARTPVEAPKAPEPEPPSTVAAVDETTVADRGRGATEKASTGTSEKTGANGASPVKLWVLAGLLLAAAAALGLGWWWSGGEQGTFVLPQPHRRETPEPVAKTVPTAKGVEDGIAPRMIAIKGGCFSMGSQTSEAGRFDDESPHRVCVKDFKIGEKEVTFAEYDRFCDSTGKDKPDAEGWGSAGHQRELARCVRLRRVAFYANRPALPFAG